MNSVQETLTIIGLSETESDIYLYLLKNGSSLGRTIFEDLQIEKSLAYTSLNVLISRELVYTIGKQRNQKFSAVDPEKLYDLLKAKQEKVDAAKIGIESLLQDMETYARQMYTKKNIQIIEGKGGFERWMKLRLEAKKGSTIREISSNLHQSGFINDQEYFKKLSLEFPKERIKKGIFMKALMQKADIENFKHLQSVEVTDPSLLKEVRLLPENFTIEAGLQTYNTKISFMREYQGAFLGIIIDDRFISSLTNNMFDAIFNLATVSS